MQSHVTKQIKYYDFNSFFDFQYEKNFFQFSALPLFTLLCGPWRKAVPAQWLNGVKFVLVIGHNASTVVSFMENWI